jgi:hypothetical protein
VNWSKPPDGFLKINWDASVNKQQKKMGAGVVVRDSAEGVLAMQCLTKGSIISLSGRGQQWSLHYAWTYDVLSLRVMCWKL